MTGEARKFKVRSISGGVGFLLIGFVIPANYFLWVSRYAQFRHKSFFLELIEGIQYSTSEKLYVLACLAAFIFFEFQSARCFLETRRGSVRLEETNIIVTDWRNRQKMVPWQSLQEVCAIYYGSRPRINLTADNQVIRISRDIEKSDELLEAILSRADLIEGRSTWLSNRYVRAQG